jgi:electron transfer flavoprotein alpha subunit
MDCLALEIDPATRRLLMTRPVYGGNAQAVQVCDTDPQIATVRTKAVAPLAKDANRKGETVNVAGALMLPLSRLKLSTARLKRPRVLNWKRPE